MSSLSKIKPVLKFKISFGVFCVLL